jgi:hypothetical protein
MTERAELEQDIEAALVKIGELVDAGDYQGAMKLAQQLGVPIELIRASAKPKEPAPAKGQITRRSLAPPKAGVFIHRRFNLKRNRRRKHHLSLRRRLKLQSQRCQRCSQRGNQRQGQHLGMTYWKP